MRTIFITKDEDERLARSSRMSARAAVCLCLVSIFLAAYPAAAESGQSPSAAIGAGIDAARASHASGSFKDAFAALKETAEGDLSGVDRNRLSDAFTELSIAEFKLRNYGNAADAVREALKLLPTNRTATDLFLTLKRERLISPSETIPQAEASAAAPAAAPAAGSDAAVPTADAQPEILSSLKRSEELQARLMGKLDAGVAELTKILAAAEQPAAAANRELRTSLGAIAKRQTELLEQTKIAAAAGEDRNRAIAELARAYGARQDFPAWLFPVLCLLALLLAASLAMNAYHLVLTIRSRPAERMGLDRLPPVRVLPAPRNPGPAVALVGSPAATAASPREEITRYLEAVADLDRPMNRDARAMQWALLIHDRLDGALEGTDMSPLTARLGKLVGKRIGLPRTECEAIYRYALILDLGYLVIDQERLSRACAARDISAEDLLFIRSHAEAGAAFLEEFGQRIPPPLFAAVRSHHERMDGSGYPEGLTGNQIPIAARIIGVCETYLALQTPRRYRAAIDPRGALEIIARTEREKFDPDIVDALTALTEKDD